MTTPTRRTRQAPLRAVLVSISKAKPEIIDTALSQLEAAIDDYRVYSKPLREEGGRPKGFSVAQTRKELASLAKVLNEALAAYERLSPPAIALLSDQIAPSKRVRAAQLSDTATAAQHALLAAKNLPDKQPDIHRRVLAMQVAVVIRDTLHVEPVTTRHTHVQQYGTKGGAAYSRVLEQVLKLAVGTSTDLEKMITAGLKLLKDPTGSKHSND